jgi:hypothetical protein
VAVRSTGLCHRQEERLPPAEALAFTGRRHPSSAREATTTTRPHPTTPAALRPQARPDQLTRNLGGQRRSLISFLLRSTF